MSEDDLGKFLKLIYGYRASVALFTATELGVFDCLTKGPTTAEEVARYCGSALHQTQHLLNACAAIGLVVKKDHQYLNSPAADNYLVTGRPNSFRNHVAFQFSVFRGWACLTEAVRSNGPVATTIKELNDREVIRLMTAGFYEAVTILGQKLPEYLDLRRHRRLFITGPASFAAAAVLVERTPGLHATILDRPVFLEESKNYLARHGVADRVKLCPGDPFQDSFGDGYDVVVLCQLLQATNGENARVLLRRAYDSLTGGALVGIIGNMLDPSRVAPAHAALWSLQSLMRSDGGGAHTTQELAEWLTEVGFVKPVVHRQPRPLVFSLMVARKP